MIHHSAWVHLKAQVNADEVTIGAGTKVWQFATVIGGTILGEDCNVGACATLSGPVIGDRCRISSGVAMGPGFKIGNDVFIGPNVVLANDMYPFVDKRGYDAEALKRGDKFCVIIEEGAAIGANAVILPGVRIGKNAIIGACSAVCENVPANHIHLRNGALRPFKRAEVEARRMVFAK